MPRTATEDLVRQLRRSSRSKSILVPRIERFMKTPLEIEDSLDRDFLAQAILAASQPRKKGVYSPSMLADCVRKVYFHKTGKEKHFVRRVEASGFFLDGNFRHLKWQFCLWKMHRAKEIVLVDVDSLCLGTEVYVCNEKGDYGGTIDNIVFIPDINFICTVDWKGMNGNSFARSIDKGPSLGYVIQSVGYVGLANNALNLPKKIEDILIIGENKNGPVNTRKLKSPLGLSEWRIDVSEYNHLVAHRLKKLRAYERREEIPPPECISTRRILFKDCPFAYHCRGEIELIERKTLRAKKKRKRGNVKFKRT